MGITASTSIPESAARHAPAPTARADQPTAERPLAAAPSQDTVVLSRFDALPTNNPLKKSIQALFAKCENLERHGYDESEQYQQLRPLAMPVAQQMLRQDSGLLATFLYENRKGAPMSALNVVARTVPERWEGLSAKIERGRASLRRPGIDPEAALSERRLANQAPPNTTWERARPDVYRHVMAHIRNLPDYHRGIYEERIYTLFKQSEARLTNNSDGLLLKAVHEHMQHRRIDECNASLDTLLASLKQRWIAGWETNEATFTQLGERYRGNADDTARFAARTAERANRLRMPDQVRMQQPEDSDYDSDIEPSAY